MVQNLFSIKLLVINDTYYFHRVTKAIDKGCDKEHWQQLTGSSALSGTFRLLKEDFDPSNSKSCCLENLEFSKMICWPQCSMSFYLKHLDFRKKWLTLQSLSHVVWNIYILGLWPLKQYVLMSWKFRFLKEYFYPSVMFPAILRFLKEDFDPQTKRHAVLKI